MKVPKDPKAHAYKRMSEYLDSFEPHRQLNVAMGVCDALFEFQHQLGEQSDLKPLHIIRDRTDPPDKRDVALAINLLRPQPKPDGKIWRTVPLPKALEDDAYAAVARVLWQVSKMLFVQDLKGTLPLTCILRELASCFSPDTKHKRRAVIRNRGKDYEVDERRDESIAWLVRDLRKTVGQKRAIAEAAALIGRNPKAVREARKRVADRHREDRRRFGPGRHKIF